MRFAVFFCSHKKGDIMEHSVLEQALEALYASDTQIVRLLMLRHQLASQLAQTSPAQETPPSLEERVAAVVARLARGNPGPLDNRRLAAIFETVIRVTEPLSVGFSTRNGAAKKG
jgi:chorismate mutase